VRHKAWRSSSSIPLCLRVKRLPRALDLRDGLELDIREMIALPLDAADIDVFDRVAGGGVDFDGTTRAVRVLPVLEDRDGLIAVEFSLRLFNHIDDRSHPVPALHAEKIGQQLSVVPLPRRAEGGI